jgi:hypothetical protein
MRRLGLLTALLAGLVTAPAAGAATFTVDDSGDAPDAAPAPGNTACATASNTCTLRAAIMQANSAAGPDTIVFRDQPTPFLIRPGTRLPAITDRVVIDGGGDVTIQPRAGHTGVLIEITDGPTTSAASSRLHQLTLDGDDPDGPGRAGPLVRVDVNDVTVDRLVARNSAANGIEVDAPAQGVRITKTPVFAYAPGAAAIALEPGANADVGAPQVRVGPRRSDGTLPVTGNTGNPGVVELFRGDPATGPQQFAADAESPGPFALLLGVEPSPGEKISATYTDQIGDTSPFATTTTPFDTVSPSLLGGVASSLSAVRVQPSEPVDPSSVQAEDFTLHMAGTERAVGGVDVAPDGSSLTLFSSTAWRNGEAGTVTLKAPGAVTDIAGNQSLQPQTARVGGAPGDFIAPAVTSLKVSPKSRICISKGPRCQKPGTTVSFISSEDGEAIYTFVRGKRTLGQRRFAVEPGRNRIRFDGRLRGRKLTAGAYKLYVGVEDAVGNVTSLQPRYAFSIRSTSRKKR